MGRECFFLATASIQVGSCFSPSRSCRVGDYPEIHSNARKVPTSGRNTSTSVSGRRQAGTGFLPECSSCSIPASGRFIAAWRARQDHGSQSRPPSPQPAYSRMHQEASKQSQGKETGRDRCCGHWSLFILQTRQASRRASKHAQEKQTGRRCCYDRCSPYTLHCIWPP